MVAIIFLAWFGATASVGGLSADPHEQSYAAERCKAAAYADAKLHPTEREAGGSRVGARKEQYNSDPGPSTTDWCVLAVQERMAVSAENAANWTWWAMFAAWAGVALLLPTLVYTGLAVGVSRRVGQAETRAYISVTFEPLTDVNPQEAKVTFRNDGVTPARNIRWGGTLLVLPHPLFLRPGVNVSIENTAPYFDIEVTNSLPSRGSQTVLVPREGFRDADLAKRAAQGVTHRYHAVGDVTYTDVFGQEHVTQFCQSWDPRECKWVISERHNLAT